MELVGCGIEGGACGCWRHAQLVRRGRGWGLQGAPESAQQQQREQRRQLVTTQTQQAVTSQLQLPCTEYHSTISARHMSREACKLPLVRLVYQLTHGAYDFLVVDSSQGLSC